MDVSGECFILQAHGREPCPDELPVPHRLFRPRLVERVPVELDADFLRRCIRKWILCEQAGGERVVVQEHPHEMQQPWLVCRIGHGGKPDLPVDARLIRGDLRQRPVHGPRFPDEVVLFPLMPVEALDDEFVALLVDRSECAIGVYDVPAVVGAIHDLMLRGEIAHHRNAQQQGDAEEHPGETLVPCVPLARHFSAFCPPGQSPGKKAREERIIEQGKDRKNGQPVKERIIAACGDQGLHQERDESGEDTQHARAEKEPRGNELGEQCEQTAELQYGLRQIVEPGGKGVGDRVGFEMIVEARQGLPALVGPQLDEHRAQLDTKQQPAKQPDDRQRCRALRERSPVEEGNQERRNESRLDHLYFPAVAVKKLADMHIRHVEDPEDNQHDRVGVAQQDDDRKGDPGPCADDQNRIIEAEPEQRRHLPESGAVSLQFLQKKIRRKNAAMTYERAHLKGEGEPGEQVDEAEESQKHEAREPIGFLRFRWPIPMAFCDSDESRSQCLHSIRAGQGGDAVNLAQNQSGAREFALSRREFSRCRHVSCNKAGQPTALTHS